MNLKEQLRKRRCHRKDSLSAGNVPDVMFVYIWVQRIHQFLKDTCNGMNLSAPFALAIRPVSLPSLWVGLILRLSSRQPAS